MSDYQKSSRNSEEGSRNSAKATSRQEKQPHKQATQDIRSYQLGKNLEQELERQRHKEALSKARSDNSVSKEVRGAFGLMFQLGTTMVVSMGIGVFFGRYLDGKLDTSPGFLILFSLLGGAAAIKVMYDAVRKRWSDDDDTNGRRH